MPTGTPTPIAGLWGEPRAVLTETGFTVTREDHAQGLLVAERWISTTSPAARQTVIAELGRISYLDDSRVEGAANRMTELRRAWVPRVAASLTSPEPWLLKCLRRC